MLRSLSLAHDGSLSHSSSHTLLRTQCCSNCRARHVVAVTFFRWLQFSEIRLVSAQFVYFCSLSLCVVVFSGSFSFSFLSLFFGLGNFGAEKGRVLYRDCSSSLSFSHSLSLSSFSLLARALSQIDFHFWRLSKRRQQKNNNKTNGAGIFTCATFCGLRLFHRYYSFLYFFTFYILCVCRETGLRGFFSVLGKQEIPTAFFPLFFVFLTYAFFLPTCAFFSFAERLTHTGRLPHTDAHAHTQTHTHRPNNKNSFAVFDFCFFSFLALISAAAEANRFLFLLFVFFYLFLHFTSIGFSYRLIR